MQASHSLMSGLEEMPLCVVTSVPSLSVTSRAASPFFSCLADFVFQAGDRAVAEVDGDGLPGCPAESLL